jgi:hypothetical protein
MSATHSHYRAARALQLVGMIAPWFLGIALLCSAVLKISSLDHFSWYIATITMKQAAIYTDKWQWVVYFVPLGEVVIGCALLHPYTQRAGLYLCLAMLAAYTTFLAKAMIYPVLPCDCFGSVQLFKDARVENHFGVARNAIFILLALTALTTRAVRPNQPQDA